MLIVKPEGSPPSCRSEREFMRVVHEVPGLYIANANVPNSTTPGAFTREVDGILLTPSGIYTVEVKGIRATGELCTPRMDAWCVVDGDTRTVIPGRPHTQALQHSKFLASFLKDTGIAPGWIRAVLAIVADGVRLPDNAAVHVIDNVHVVIAAPGVGTVLTEDVGATLNGRELSVEMVQEILTVFGCVESAPSTDELTAQGFRSESEIAADIDRKRQQVQDEFAAAKAARTTDSTDEGAPPADIPADIAPVADAPSTTEWEITEERFRAAVALDAELTETGAFVDGVAIHKRLIGYTERKNITLESVAAIVNNPVDVFGDESDSHIVYCGNEFAVSVRSVDGLAMFYKPVAEARAERFGATVDGVEITARAARQAIGQFSLSVPAVARIVAASEERWWVPGTTDIAHARGEFVAVTSGHLGPVQYLQTRAVAVQRAAPKPTPETSGVTRVTDQEVDGVTIRASAVGWCARRNVALSSIAAIVQSPQAVWAGHSENMEVRSGSTNAVLLDVSDMAVVAVMTASEAVEYRDGIVKDGVRLTGRCVFLVKRRKRTVDEIISAFKEPAALARAAGTPQTYRIGESLAVIVDDETNAVSDFTYTEHAWRLVNRGDLIVVDAPAGMEAPTPEPLATVPVERAAPSFPSVRTPSPARVAALAAAKVSKVTGQVASLAVNDASDDEPVMDDASRPPVPPSPLLLAMRARAAG